MPCHAIGWLVDWLIGWTVDWLVGGTVDRLIDWLVGWSFGGLIGCLIDRSVNSIGWLIDPSTGLIYWFARRVLSVQIVLTPLEPQSRLGTKLLEIWLVCTQNGTTVLKGLNPINVVGFSFSCCAIFRSMPIHFPPKTVILGGVYSSLRLCEEPQKEKVESALRRMRRPFSP